MISHFFTAPFFMCIYDWIHRHGTLRFAPCADQPLCGEPAFLAARETLIKWAFYKR